MNPLIIAPILEIGKSILDRLFPDPVLKAKAEMEMMVLLQTQDLQKVMGQLEINAKEAASTSVFVAGWRPGAGWASVAGLVYATIGHPLLSWLSVMNGWPSPPQIDTDTLLYVLGGMLGLGTLRSVEKIKGAA